MFLLYAGEAFLNGGLVELRLGLFAQVFNRTDQESARAACRIQDSLAQARVNLLNNELRDGARSVELTRIARGLEVLEDERDAAMRADALRIVTSSAEQALARLQFIRIAFGAAGFFAPVSGPDLEY